MTTLLDLALKYAARGLRVFPCKPADKVPATVHGVLDATTDATRIEAWWTAYPTCNIGVATGGGLLVVDVDSIDAEAELKQLEDRFGALPATIESITAKVARTFPRNMRIITAVNTSPIPPSLPRLAIAVFTKTD